MSVTPFALAVLLALLSSLEGLAAVSMRKVLAMPSSSPLPHIPEARENRLTSPHRRR
jgi:hypothetical protein